MANRLVTKALAGIQDLLLGRQTVTQARASGNVSISGIYANNIPHDTSGGLTIHGKLAKKVEVVTNIAALQALDTDAVAFNELYVYVQGYFTATDGGGGLFWLDVSDTSSAEDLKYIFNPDTLANGRWKRVDPDDQLTNDNGDANIVLTVTSYKNQLFSANFTANRTATLPTTGLYKGKTFRIVRTNTAAYTLTLVNITPSVVLNASEASTTEVVWDGTAWQHVSKSVQIVNTAAFLTPYDPAKLYWAHESSPLAMSVTIDAGRLTYTGVMISNTQQTVAIAAADVTNPRIDRVTISESTGIATVTTGTPAASPVAPTIPSSRIPICQVLVPANGTAVSNSQITDERAAQTSDFKHWASITITTAITIAAGVYATLTYGVESADTDDIFNPAAPTIFTVPAGYSKAILTLYCAGLNSLGGSANNAFVGQIRNTIGTVICANSGFGTSTAPLMYSIPVNLSTGLINVTTGDTFSSHVIAFDPNVNRAAYAKFTIELFR